MKPRTELSHYEASRRKLDIAQALIRDALEMARSAAAPGLVKKLVSARASCGGAIRHADLRANRGAK